MRHLFICGTPLQARIAESIISTEVLPASECAAFFYTNVANKKYLHYFDRLSHVCNKSHLFVADGHTAKSLFQAKKELAKIQFETVYFASPISAYSILALGLGRHTALYTFDDGTANIFANSSYSKGKGLSLKKSIALKILGSFYGPDRIKRESLGHYTIYPQFKNNLSKKLIAISIFNPPQTPSANLKCSVILGTVFHEVFDRNRADQILHTLCGSIKARGHDVFFLRHPRDLSEKFNEFRDLNSGLMAEDEILNLLCRYSEIDLYGFCSSAQINLAQIPRVNTILIRTREIQESFSQMQRLFKTTNWRFKTLDL